MTYEGMPFTHGPAFLLTAFYAVWLHVISLPAYSFSILLSPLWMKSCVS